MAHPVVTGFCNRYLNCSTNYAFFWEVHEVCVHSVVPEADLRSLEIIKADLLASYFDLIDFVFFPMGS